MLENMYTTKMSVEKKKLQSRFAKIRSKNGRISKIMALIVFAVILMTMVCVTVIIAMSVNYDDYTMTDSEFTEFVNRPIGAVMAELYYADDSKFVFHYGEGFFIIHRQDSESDSRFSSEIDMAINLKKLKLDYSRQGSCVLDVKISKDGQIAYLSTVGPADEIKNYEKYIIYLDNGAVKKGNMPENAELFTEIADTFTTIQNPVGWCSNNCITNMDKTYYLTTETGIVGDIRLVTVDKSNNKIDVRHVFGKKHMSISQSEEEQIKDTLTDGEEILTNSGLRWMVNADVVRAIFNKLSGSRNMKHIDVKEGDYDIISYQIWKNDEATPRLYVIDNSKVEIIFSTDLNKKEYFEINNLVYKAQEKNIKIYTPADVKDITDVELIAGGIKYPLRDRSMIAEIEKNFSTATPIKGGTACPFTAELLFTRAGGEKGSVTIATDSCAVFKSGEMYYDYSDGDNSDLLMNCFAVSHEELIDLSINKSYMPNSEMAVRNFFTAFDKSDLSKMKTLVTNEFIAKGYIGDYDMCYGMTRATLETCSEANVDEFLKVYFAEPEHAQITLSENDIELLKSKSDELMVYSVVVTAEHNIKGETQRPYKRFLNVICKKQKNGGYLVHKLY